MPRVRRCGFGPSFRSRCQCQCQCQWPNALVQMRVCPHSPTWSSDVGAAAAVAAAALDNPRHVRIFVFDCCCCRCVCLPHVRVRVRVFVCVCVCFDGGAVSCFFNSVFLLFAVPVCCVCVFVMACRQSNGSQTQTEQSFSHAARVLACRKSPTSHCTLQMTACRPTDRIRVGKLMHVGFHFCTRAAQDRPTNSARQSRIECSPTVRCCCCPTRDYV